MKAMTMKQYNQSIENITAKAIFNAAFNELDAQQKPVYHRLRTCTAWVFETENFLLLKSYDTIIAAIDKRTSFCVDVLRDVYGYTSTSAQHIAKFFSDYASSIGKWRSDLIIYTYRDI